MTPLFFPLLSCLDKLTEFASVFGDHTIFKLSSPKFSPISFTILTPFFDFLIANNLVVNCYIMFENC